MPVYTVTYENGSLRQTREFTNLAFATMFARRHGYGRTNKNGELVSFRPGTVIDNKGNVHVDRDFKGFDSRKSTN